MVDMDGCVENSLMCCKRQTLVWEACRLNRCSKKEYIGLVCSTMTARNQGLIFNQDILILPYIKPVFGIAFFHLCNIAKIRNIRSQSDAERLDQAFMLLLLLDWTTSTRF